MSDIGWVTSGRSTMDHFVANVPERSVCGRKLDPAKYRNATTAGWPCSHCQTMLRMRRNGTKLKHERKDGAT